MASCGTTGANRFVYAASAPDVALCMTVFLDYVYSPLTNSRLPDAFTFLSWIGSTFFCIIIAWLHWEAYQARKNVIQ